MRLEKTIAVIVAAGSGVRAGGGVPKQFAPLAGRAMIAHAYDAFADHPAIDAVLVVIAQGDEARLHMAIGDVPFVHGGATRKDSVANALAEAARIDATRVLIHDAARPLIPAAVIARVIGALSDHAGATPAMPAADTLARGDILLGDVVEREGLFRIQTPQGFRLDALLAAHEAWPSNANATDDAQMVRALGGSVALVQGDPMLEKVTYPQDFATAEARFAWEFRTATGFDVHRLEAGEELWLGGVLIPHDKGLSGHSDADVALHAITDALLGTIAAGDIGTHFPPSDPQWKGADSARFLKHAAKLVADKGGRIDFVDLTLMCEAPKIGPHRAAMTTRIADLLGISPERVSIKATTTEKLGFTGRGEGIAAQAAASIRLPEQPR